MMFRLNPNRRLQVPGGRRRHSAILLRRYATGGEAHERVERTAPHEPGGQGYQSEEAKSGVRPHERQGEQPEPKDDAQRALGGMFVLRKQS